MSDPKYVDPHRIAIEAKAYRAWAQPETFADVMAEQLRRAPWFAVSLLFHVIAFLILLNIPTKLRSQQEPVVISAMPIEDEPVVDETPPEPPEETKPKQLDDPDFVDPTIDERVATDDPVEPDLPTENPVDANAFFDTPIGIGPGQVGPGGGRPGRRIRAPRKILPRIDDALAWLRRHQDSDGHWSSAAFMKHCPAGDVCSGAGNPVNDVGLTGLALLAFLGDGSTVRGGRHKRVVKRAVLWLREQMDDRGLFGTETGHAYMYNHALASLGMVEAYGLSRYKTLKPYAQRCVDYILKARNPYKVWRYYPHDGDNDTSVTGWMVFVLKSAQDFGLEVDGDALKYSLAWFDEVTDPATGQCGYTKRGEPSSRKLGQSQRFPPSKSEAMTAVGLLCRIFLGQKPKEQPVLLAAADTMLKRPPVWNEADGSIDLYYWYYATYAMFQLRGKRWQRWQKHLKPALLNTQRRKTHVKGSWDPVCVWGEDGGRVYSTAIGVLCLEAYYRYSRLIR